MFAKISLVVCFFLVVECAAQHQRFLEVPFDSDVKQGFPQTNFVAKNTNERPQQFFEHNDPQLQKNQRPGPLFQVNNPAATTPQRNSFIQREEHAQNLFAPTQQPRNSFQAQQFNNDFQPARNTFQSVETSRHSFEPGAPATPIQVRFNQQTQPFAQLERATPTPIRIRQPEHRFGTGSSNFFNPSNEVAIRSQPNQFFNSQQVHRKPIQTFSTVNEPFVRNAPSIPERPLQPPENIAVFLGMVHPTTNQPPVAQQIFNTPTFTRTSIPEQVDFQSQSFPVRQAPRIQPVHAIPATHVRSGTSFGNRGSSDDQLQEQLFKQQAESAQYSFSSQVDDSINDQQLQREEVRDGVNVKGMYSYADGYVRRIVEYVADDKGFRIVREQEEPLGNGPTINPNGQANVHASIDGNTVNYSITSADFPKEKAVPLQGRRF